MKLLYSRAYVNCNKPLIRSAFDIRFVAKTSDIRNFSQNIRSDFWNIRSDSCGLHRMSAVYIALLLTQPLHRTQYNEARNTDDASKYRFVGSPVLNECTFKTCPATEFYLKFFVRLWDLKQLNGNTKPVCKLTRSLAENRTAQNI